MKFSWNWLSDYVDLKGVDPMDVANRFTMTVAELEGVEHIGAGLGDIIVGEIVAIDEHPFADKLQVIVVDVGNRTVKGVSGAPNLYVGMHVPTALPGTVLPGDKVVNAVDLRGVHSEVVILSEKEMGLSDDHSGVVDLTDSGAQPGHRLVDQFGVEDFVFEVDNKSINHRPDLWGHLGIAREIAAMTGRRFIGIDSRFEGGSDDLLAVAVDDHKDCPRYMAMCYGGIKIEPSPWWIARRLRTVGLRPISNVVDLTNYIMLATGEPMHAFDRRQVGGDTIRVRRAVDGESFRTLDGQDHVLTTNDLLIADANRGVALAGVMGGENSEIADDTIDVVLECANFHPAMIRRTALRHAIRTDSSARFEKSLDPNIAVIAMAEFTRMLANVSKGARPTSRVYDIGGPAKKAISIALDPAWVSRRLGLDVSVVKIKEILENLGFGVTLGDDGVLAVSVPSWRATRDIKIREDLLEEVGRVIGYDNMPPQPAMAAVSLVEREPKREMIRRIKRILTAECNYDEIETYSFVSSKLLDYIGYVPENPVKVRNPIADDLASLRTELVLNLLGTMAVNTRNYGDFDLFETGRVFRDQLTDEGIPWQAHSIGMMSVRRGVKDPAGHQALFLKVRGSVEVLSERIGLMGLKFETIAPNRPWMHPMGTVSVSAGSTVIGYVSWLHPATLKALDGRGAVVVAELSLPALLSAPRGPSRFVPVPRFPAVKVDLSLVMNSKMPAGEIAAVISANGGALLKAVDVVDVYSGEPIPELSKSVTYRMTFASNERTLEDAEVQQAMTAITSACKGRGVAVWGAA